MLQKTLISVAVSLSLAFASGCQSLSGVSADPDPRLQQEEINVEGSSYATACIVGAGVGLLACAIAGSDDASCYALAAAGGCGVGLAGNALLDNLRQNYATREAQLDALNAKINTNNEQASKLLKVANTVYNEDKQRLAQIKKEIAAGTMKKDDLEYTIARYNANIELLQENIEGHSKALESYQYARQGILDESRGNLTKAERQELAQCEKRIAELQRDIEAIRATCTNFIRDRDVLNLAANNTDVPISG